MCILTVHVDVHSGLQRVRSIVIRSVAFQLGVQVLATEIPHCDLVANKIVDNSGNITRHLLIPIPRDHWAGVSYDTRNKEINTIFEILTAMFPRVLVFFGVRLHRWVREEPLPTDTTPHPRNLNAIIATFSTFFAHTIGDCCGVYPLRQKMSLRLLCALID